MATARHARSLSSPPHLLFLAASPGPSTIHTEQAELGTDRNRGDGRGGGQVWSWGGPLVLWTDHGQRVKVIYLSIQVWRGAERRPSHHIVALDCSASTGFACGGFCWCWLWPWCLRRSSSSLLFSSFWCL